MDASVNHTRPLLDALALLLQLAHPSTYSEMLHSTGLFSLLIATIVEDKVSLSSVYIMDKLTWKTRQMCLSLPAT